MAGTHSQKGTFVMEAADVVVGSAAVFGRGDISESGVGDGGGLAGHNVASADQVGEDGAHKGLVLGWLDLGHVCGLRGVENWLRSDGCRLCLSVSGRVSLVAADWKRRCFEKVDRN